MKKYRYFLPVILVVVAALTFGCGESKTEKLKSGVMFAESALAQVGPNPFMRAQYKAMIDAGQTPVDFIKAVQPKGREYPTFEYEKPTHSWTIVVRPGTANPDELFIEGYGDDTKSPMISKSIIVRLPEE
jgi:hypothetical protein